MLFALSTQNIPKTQALRHAIDQCPYFVGHELEIRGFRVSSGVPDMPLTLLSLREGAKNRAKAIRTILPEADYFIGMEGGVYRDSVGDEYWLTGVVYIENIQGEGHFGYSCHMPVPPLVVSQLYDGSGRDLEQILESLGAPPNVGDTQGSFGLWSDGMLSRSDQFRLATQCALSPFFNNFYTK